MNRSAYLFRMFADDLARLNALSKRFGGKRETLSVALVALERQQAERDAVSSEARSSLLARIEGLEQRVTALEATPRRKSGSTHRTRQSET